MDQFASWSGIAHAIVSKHVPHIKLGQVHQIFAACLGHKTYASLRVADLDTLNQRPRYCLFDDEAGLVRATGLGLSVTPAMWREVMMAISRSGITPFWLTSWRGMHMAANLHFEDSSDMRIHALKVAFGEANGQWATSSRCHSDEDALPDTLQFSVDGNVGAYTEHESLVIPVTAIVTFPKLGQRLYGNGTIISVEQSGAARRHDDAIDGEVEFEVFGMSED